MFALVREPSLPRGDHQGADSSVVPGDGDETAGMIPETEDWTLVLTPETAWATAEDEPSAPPSETPNDYQNDYQNNQNSQNDEAGGQSNCPAATNPPPSAELIDPRVNDTAGATKGSMGTLRVDVDGAFICLFVWEIRLTSHVFCSSQRLAFRSISCVQSRTKSSTIRSYTPTGTRTAGARYRRGYEGAKRRR